METKYKALRFVATIYKIFAWIFLVLGILGLPGGVIGGLIISPNYGYAPGPGSLLGLGAGIILVLLGVLLFIVFLSFGQFIYVFMDIEDNTRKAYLLMEEKYTIVEQEN